MKRLFLLLLVVGSIVLVPPVHAQQAVMTDYDQDTITYVNNSMLNVRKGLLYAGGGIMVSGLASSAFNGIALSPFVADVDGESLGSLPGLFSLPLIMAPAAYALLFGGCAALIGSLFPSDNPRYNGSNYYLGDRSGFTVMVDAIPFIMTSINVTAGYHFNEHFYLGGGIGTYLPLLTAERFHLAPLVDFRYSLTDERVTPYVGLNAGALVITETQELPAETYPTAALLLGARIRSNSPKGGDWWVGGSADFLMFPSRIFGISWLGVRAAYSF
ncbi:MAG: hypothetical protein J6U70_02025 [Bacteroidales bacterium]|nr:hypothetical protein [Bacteroidales bacterium]